MYDYSVSDDNPTRIEFVGNDVPEVTADSVIKVAALDKIKVIPTIK